MIKFKVRYIGKDGLRKDKWWCIDIKDIDGVVKLGGVTGEWVNIKELEIKLIK